MKLVSMKRSEAAKSDAMECSPCHGDMPDYPYGTRLNLDEEQLSQLGITAMPSAGEPMWIEARGVVTGMREEHIDGKLRRGLEIQITDLALDGGPGESMAKTLYADNGKG